MNEELRRLYALLLQGAKNGPVPTAPRDYSEVVRGITEEDFVKRYSDRAELNSFLNDVNKRYPNFFQGSSPQQLLSYIAPIDQRLTQTRERADAKLKVVTREDARNKDPFFTAPPTMPTDHPEVRQDDVEVKKVLRAMEFAKEFKPGEATIEEFYAGQYPEKLAIANREAALVAKEFKKKYPDGQISPYEVAYGPTGANLRMTADEILQAESIPGIGDEGLLLAKRTVKQHKLILAEQQRNAINLYDSWMNDVYQEHVTPQIQEALNLVDEVMQKQEAKQPIDKAEMDKAIAAQQMLDALPAETKHAISAVAKGSQEAQVKREALDRDYPELRIVEELNANIQMKKDQFAFRQEQAVKNRNKGDDLAASAIYGINAPAALAIWRTLRGAAEIIPKGAEELASSYNAVSAVWSDDAKARLIRRAHRDVMPGTFRDSTKEMRPPLEQTAWLKDKDSGKLYEVGYDSDGRITNIYNENGYQARLTDSHYSSLIDQAEETDLFETSAKTRLNGSAMFNQVVDGTTDLAITYLLARGIGSLGKVGRVGKFLESSGPVATRLRESIPILFQYTGRIAEEGIRQGLSPEAAVTYGGIGSAAEALIESAAPFLGKVTGARRAALRESMQRILADPAELKKLKNGVFKEMAVFGTLGEAGEEVAAVEIQPITNRAVNALFDTQVLETDRASWQEYASSGALGLFVSAVPGLIGGISNSRRVASDDFLKESIYNAVLQADKVGEIAAAFNDPKYTQLATIVSETQAFASDIIEDKTIPQRRKVELVAMQFDVTKRMYDLEAAKGTASERKVSDDLEQRKADLDNERASVQMPETDDRPIKTRVAANPNGKIWQRSWTSLRPGDVVQVHKPEVTPEGIRISDELELAEVEYVDPQGEYVQFKGQGENASGFRRYSDPESLEKFGGIFLPEETVPEEGAVLHTEQSAREAIGAEMIRLEEVSQREIQAKREDLERRRKAELEAPAPGVTPDQINAKYDAELSEIENPVAAQSDQGGEAVPGEEVAKKEAESVEGVETKLPPKNQPIKGTKKVAEHFNSLVKNMPRDDVDQVLYDWQEGQLNEDGTGIVIEGAFKREAVQGDGPKIKPSKRAFLEWLNSDAPFDTKVYGADIREDQEYVDRINQARKAAGFATDQQVEAVEKETAKVPAQEGEFDFTSLFTDEQGQEAAVDRQADIDQEREEKYQASEFDKTWAPDYKTAKRKLTRQYKDAEAEKKTWEAKVYKSAGSASVTVGKNKDDFDQRTMNIDRINEGRRQKAIKRAEATMAESVRDLGKLGLSKEEIDAELSNEVSSQSQSTTNVSTNRPATESAPAPRERDGDTERTPTTETSGDLSATAPGNRQEAQTEGESASTSPVRVQGKNVSDGGAGQSLSSFKKGDIVYRNFDGVYEEYEIVETGKDIWKLRDTETGAVSEWNALNNGGFFNKADDSSTPNEQDNQGQDQEVRQGKSTPSVSAVAKAASEKPKTVTEKVKQALALTVGNDVRGMVMQYLLENKIHSQIIRELYGGRTRGGDTKKIQNEVRARLSMVDNSRIGGATTLSQLGDEIWGYFGSPDEITGQEFANAAADILSDFTNRGQIADAVMSQFGEIGADQYEAWLLANMDPDSPEAAALAIGYLDTLTDEDFEKALNDELEMEESPLVNPVVVSPKEGETRTPAPKPEPATPMPVNLRTQLENKLKDAFKLSHAKAVVAARVIDRLFRTMAEREGVPVEAIYGSVNFVEGTLLDAQKLGSVYGLTSEQVGRIAGAMWEADGKAIVAAFFNPTITTPLHEVAHVYQKYLTEEERQAIMRAGGYTTWSVETSEYFARGFERYLAEGVAPAPDLQPIFDKLKQFFLDVYHSIVGSDIEVQLTPEMRQIYARMLGYDIPATMGPNISGPTFTDVKQIGDWLFSDGQLPLFQIADKTDRTPITVKDVKIRKEKSERGQLDGVHEVVYNGQVIGVMNFDKGFTNQWHDVDSPVRSSRDPGYFGIGWNRQEAAQYFVDRYNENNMLLPQLASDNALPPDILRNVPIEGLRHPKRNTVVFVSPEKLLQRHAKDDPDFEVQNPKNRIGQRVEKAEQFIKNYATDQRAINPTTGERMGGLRLKFEPSVAQISKTNNKLWYEDGRHRVLAAYNLGLSVVPVEVPKGQAALFEKEFAETKKSRQLSIFDIQHETEVETGTGQKEKVQFTSHVNGDYPTSDEVRKEEDTVPNKHNIRTVAHVWRQDKNLQFTGTTRVKNAADVAHIMRLLEDKSVELAFAVHVDADGNSHVQFLSVGGIAGTVVDPVLVLAGSQHFKAVKTYLVHNHPSGKTDPSQEDIRLTDRVSVLLNGIGIELEHVIMDTYNEKYTLLRRYGSYDILSRRDSVGETEDVEIAAHMVDSMKVLSKPLKQITTSEEAAQFIYGLRFSALPKAGMIVLDRRSYIIGNYVFQDDFDVNEAAREFANHATAQSIIFYGNQPLFRSRVRDITGVFKDTIKVLDYVTVKGGEGDVKGAYESAADQGLLGDVQAEYGTNTLVAEKAGPLFGGSQQTDLFGLMNNTAPTIQREKADADALKRQEAFDRKKPLAPNGKPSNLTPAQWAQVRTPEFKAWFGDWEKNPARSSKILDENGEPKVMYHATTAAKNILKEGFKSESGVYWFTDSKEIGMDEAIEGEILPVFLNARNIYEWQDDDPEPDATGFKDKVTEEGFDAIKAPSNVGDDDYVVFEPDQIKSATDNSGAFDPNNPSILLQNPGDIKQRILTRLRAAAPQITQQGVKAEELYSAKRQEFDAAGVTIDDINAVLMAHIRPEREAPIESVQQPINSPVADDIIHYTMTMSDETNKMLSGATWQDVFGEKPEGDQLYFVSKLNDMLQDGKNMTTMAMRRWGASVMDYGPPLFDLIKSMSDDMSNKKAVLLATFLGELQQEKVTSNKTREIARFENQVFAYYQHYMNIQGKRVAAGRLIRLYRDRFLAEIYEDMILEEADIKARKAVERGLAAKIEGTEAPTTITEKEKKREDDIAKNRSEKDQVEKKKKRKSAPSQASTRAQVKANEILSKTGLPDMQAFMERLRNSSKNIKCP